MLTPQQIDEVTLDTAVFGGYDTKSVDAFLEPLIEDYTTLYKENALLKSKMRILVEKLEEYRANEASLRDAMDNTRKTCDQMLLDAEAKCNRMLEEANAAAQNAPAAQQTRREDDRRIARIQEQMQSCIAELEQLKSEPGQEPAKKQTEDDMAAEIAANLQNLIGTPEEPAPMPQNRNRRRGR